MNSIFGLTVKEESGKIEYKFEWIGDKVAIEKGITAAIRGNIEFRVFIIQCLLNSIGEKGVGPVTESPEKVEG